LHRRDRSAELTVLSAIPIASHQFRVYASFLLTRCLPEAF
jgi:hypothetical protein